MTVAASPSNARKSLVGRFILSLALALSVVALALGFLAYRYWAPAASDASRFADKVPSADGALPSLWQVPPFALHDQHGGPVGPEALAGHVWIADFMFTTCTSLCPMITSKLVLLQHQLADPALRFVSFSVDPVHDTQAALAGYAEHWNAREMRWLLLRTEPASLSALADGMKVMVGPSGDAKNPILHTKLLFLVDGKGQVRGVYDSDDPQALARLRTDARRVSQDTAAPADAALPDSGEALFQAAGCAGCHDNPQVAPPLGGVAGSSVELTGGGHTVADTVYLRESLEKPAARVVAGYLNIMPSYAGQLSGAQLEALVAYVGSLKAEPTPTLPPAVQEPAPGAPAKLTASARAEPAASVAPRAGTAPAASAAANLPARIVTDPVCGMSVRVTDATPRAVHADQTYYFCSDSCREHFSATPAQYLSHPPKSMDMP